MESKTLTIGYISQQPRWDFHYFDDKYLQIEKLLDQGKYPIEPLANYTKQIVNFGAYSLCNLLVWVNDGIPYLRVTDLKEDGISWSNVPRIPHEIHIKLPKSKVYPGDVLYSMAGTIGLSIVAPEEIGECNSNQAIAKIRLKSDRLNPYYLATFLNSQLGRYQSERIANGQTVFNINMGEIGLLRIPIPPRPIQDRIAQIMQDAYARRQHKLAEAEKLYQTIDNYVFTRLGISLEKVQEKKRFIKPIAEMYESRFDVDFNMGFHKFDPYINQVLPVKAVAKFPKRTRKLSNDAEAIFHYIDISSIDIKLGTVEGAIEVTEANAPSRARQVVHTGDIIVSTVRPTRGAIALIQNDMEGFICSTGFTIIHSTEKISSAYLHLALRLSTTLEQFRRRSAGSSYPAILESDIKETLIPVPDKEVQNEIATEITQRSNKAKSLHTQAENLVYEAKARIERMILGEEDVT